MPRSNHSINNDKKVVVTGNKLVRRPGMVTRIIVVLLVSLVHCSLGLAQTQQPKKVARVGFLSLGFPPTPSALHIVTLRLSTRA
jgi:hypothetical protein